MNISKNEKVRIGDTAFGGAATASLEFAKDRRGDYILAGDEVIADAGDGVDTYEVLKVLPGNKVKIGGLGVEVATVDAKTVSVTRKHGVLKRDGDTVVLKNAAYSSVLKGITDSVKPYLDKRIKGDLDWKYPAIVIAVLRRVCDSATMSAGRYDGQRPPHKVHRIECVKDGMRFTGDLVITGLLHYPDADDNRAFDEYDMTLDLSYAGKAANATRIAGPNEVVTLASSSPVVQNAVAWRARNAVDPRMQKEYDRYIKAKAAFDKWWTPDRRLSERSRQLKELQDAEKGVWTTYREIYGKPIPSGWGEPGKLKSIIESAGKIS